MLTAEKVEVWTPYPQPHLVGHGLLARGLSHWEPVLQWQGRAGVELYSVHDLPTVWGLHPLLGHVPGPLLEAWREIEAIQERLKVAEREAEEDERDRAEQREIDARISQELVEGREGDNVDTTHAD